MHRGQRAIGEALRQDDALGIELFEPRLHPQRAEAVLDSLNDLLNLPIDGRELAGAPVSDARC